MSECRRCMRHSLCFDRLYSPTDFIEGHVDSRVWIVGLNPLPPEQPDTRTVAGLRTWLLENRDTTPYFRDFKTVSSRLHSMLGVKQGAAHTDLVKCFSETWPPKGTDRAAHDAIIANCRQHLEQQLTQWRPRVVVCNGAPVSREILKILPPASPGEVTTSYIHSDGELSTCIILSGFIGRIDTWAKRRLGIEIERRLDELDT